MKLVITEKPSVAQSLAKVIGARERKAGYLEGNGYLVSWCVGHLVEPAPPEAYDERYKLWRYEDLPILPEKWKYEVSPSTKKQFEVLKMLMERKDVERLICATDAGREGELIFRLVYHKAGCTKPFDRLWISSMEDVAIREGFRNLMPSSEYDNLYKAALCRERADWIVGINATRLFSCLYGQTLNVGRVMTPTLAMTVARDAAISAFKPKPFYTVQIEVSGCTITSERFEDRDEADELWAACMADGEAVVREVSEKEIREEPPQLYDLTTLQRDANRLYGFTAKQTLDYLQSLYEKKAVTYPRTDSRYITADMEASLGRIVTGTAEMFGYELDYEIDEDVVIDDDEVSDHHAILPTISLRQLDLKILSDGEKKILGLVVTRVIAAVSPAFRYEETVITLECGGHVFTLKGKAVIDKGWKLAEEQLLPLKNERKKEPDTSGFAEGHIVPLGSATVKEGKTSPPAHFTEDTLLHVLETAGNGGTDADGNELAKIPEGAERRGLGTSATRAAIIEKLVDKGFIARRKGRKKQLLCATDKGTALITVIPEQIQSVAMTAEWEEKLLRIEKGEYPPELFMQEIGEMVQELVSTYEPVRDPNVLLPSRTVAGRCPHCGAEVIETTKGWECMGKECRFMIWKDNAFFKSIGARMTGEMAEKLISTGEVRVDRCVSRKNGKEYPAIISLDLGPDGTVRYKMRFPDRKKKGGGTA